MGFGDLFIAASPSAPCSPATAPAARRYPGVVLCCAWDLLFFAIDDPRHRPRRPDPADPGAGRAAADQS